MSDEEFVDVIISIRKDDLDKWHVYPDQKFVGWKIDTYSRDALGTRGELLIILPDGSTEAPKWPVGTLVIHDHENHSQVVKANAGS